MGKRKNAGDNYGIQIGAGGTFSAESVAVGDQARIDNRNRANKEDALKEAFNLRAELQRMPASSQRLEGACHDLEEAIKQKTPDVPKIKSRLEEIASVVKASASIVEETFTIFGYLKKIATIFGIAIGGLNI